MGWRKLRDRDPPTVALDKGDLEVDDVLDESGDVPDDQRVHYQRLAPRVYVIRVPRGGTIPEFQEQLAIRA